MASRIKQWVGFSVLSFWTKKDGRGMYVKLVGYGKKIRVNPDDAWSDALKEEGKNDTYVREKKIRNSTINTGICPPEYADIHGPEDK